VNWKTEWKPLVLIAAAFVACLYLPVDSERFSGAIFGALELVRWYAREHVMLCLIPAFFIAGALGVFISQASVMKYLGARANKALAYGVASVSGTVLAVCSCTVLPLFAGIYRMGGGLGPATAFLYSGPAINVMAITLTARVLGIRLGIARAVGAVVFSIVIGLLMHLIFRREEAARTAAQAQMPVPEASRPLWQNAVFFAAMVGVLVFANWGAPDENCGAAWRAVHAAKWPITSAFAAGLGFILIRWIGIRWWRIALAAIPTAVLAVVFRDRPMIPFTAGIIGLSVLTASGKGEPQEWFASSWGFARQIMPLLLAGVLIAGFFLGVPEEIGVRREGIIPSAWVHSLLGGNSLRANLIAAVAGAFMYFCTLMEVPVLRGLLDAGMGKGPALALLLAGPALSLPNMLVIRSVMGTKKTVVYVSLVVVMATISGMLYGAFLG